LDVDAGKPPDSFENRATAALGGAQTPLPANLFAGTLALKFAPVPNMAPA